MLGSVLKLQRCGFKYLLCKDFYSQYLGNKEWSRKRVDELCEQTGLSPAQIEKAFKRNQAGFGVADIVIFYLQPRFFCPGALCLQLREPDHRHHHG